MSGRRGRPARYADKPVREWHGQQRGIPGDFANSIAAPTTLSEFLAGLAAAVPPLNGARCRGRFELFDRAVTKADARDAALHICDQCPALDACREWVSGLPTRERPAGVIAGQVIT